MKKRILAVVHDPGGTKALVPVLADLQARAGVELRVLAGPFARTLLKENKISFRAAPSQVSATWAQRSFKTFGPEHLLTASSWNSNLEQRFRNEAFHQKIPSFVLVDFWTNYRERWLGADYSVKKLADTLGVVDQAMARQMREEGFPGKRIQVVGHPFLEQLGEKTLGGKARSRTKSVRLVFLSERLTEKVREQFAEHPLEMALAGISTWAEKLGRRVIVDFKPHPKEVLDHETRAILKKYQSALGLKVLARAQSFRRLVTKYEYFFGYNTIGLLEAKILGKTVFSMSVIPRGEAFMLALKRHGIPRLECRSVAVARAWSRLRSGKAKRSRRPYQGATKAIVRELLT